MGDVADMMLEGTLCCACGVILCADVGPAICEDCWSDSDNRRAWPGAILVSDADAERLIGTAWCRSELGCKR